MFLYEMEWSVELALNANLWRMVELIVWQLRSMAVSMFLVPDRTTKVM